MQEKVHQLMLLASMIIPKAKQLSQTKIPGQKGPVQTSCVDFKSEVHLDSVYTSLVNVVQWKETKKVEEEK